MAWNDTDLPRNYRLGSLTEIEFDHCYHAGELTDDIADIAVKAPRPHTCPKIAQPHGTNTKLETKLPNCVTVYGNELTAQKLGALVAEFPNLWRDVGCVDLLMDQWMRIPLRSDWESRVSGKAKIYPLGIKDRALVDKTFDELQQQGRLQYTMHSTPFAYLVFVVWKTLPNGERKGRVVVDIRGLNRLVVPNAYPLPLQSEMHSRCKGKSFISAVDCASFFY
jgi:hypothetical protein